MTIGALIFDVAANTVKLTKDVDLINGKLDSIAGIAEKVKKAFIAAFTVTAIVKIGREVINFASHLTDLSTKTGISTTGLQKLELAFAESGISIDQVSKASEFLANVLVKGDKGPIALLQKLGLNADVLKNMSLDEMFITVGDAIGKMGNKAEQIYASKTLLGKGGVELLAGLTGNLKTLTDGFADLGLIIDEKTIHSADEFGDKLGLLNRAGLVFTSEVLGPALPGLAKLAQWLSMLGKALVTLEQVIVDKVINAFLRFKLVYLQMVLSIHEGIAKVPLLAKAFGVTADGIEEFRRQIQQAKDQITLFNMPIATAATAVKAAVQPLGDLGATAEEAATKAKKLREELTKLQGSTTQLTSSIAVWAHQLIEAITPAELMAVQLRAINAATIGVSASMSQKLIPGSIAVNGRLADIEQGTRATTKSLTSFGTVIDKVGLSYKDLDAATTDYLSTLAMGGGIIGGFTAAWKSHLQTVAIIQGAIDEVEARINDVLAKRAAAIAEANALIETLQGATDTTTQKMGTLRAMTPELRTALETVFAAKTPQEYADAIGRVNREVDIAIGKQQELDESLGRLKTSWEVLGPTARAQYLGEWATGVKQDILTVVAAGADLNYTIGLAGPELSKIVQAAKRSGTEIPSALRPVLEQAAKLGVLFSKNGDELEIEYAKWAKANHTTVDEMSKVQKAAIDQQFAITNLTKYGVTFGETFEESMLVVKDAMLEVVNVLGEIRDAIMGIPNNRRVTITVEEKLIKAGSSLAAKKALGPGTIGDPFVMHAGGPVGRMLQFAPRAHSGLAVGEVPIIAQRGEVMFSRANVAAMGGVGATESFRRGLGSGRGSVVNISTARLEAQMEALRKEQAAMREAFLGQQRQLPALTAIAARDAMQQQARRR